ncbi:hypothetical protein [Acrocarpospora sp. B8E8]|uniref:hypothetical protein n=1 Tax=Acrocarpospora sp. B8E8 TaxID=3153572 RepID=UPI00325F26AB
MYAELDRRAEVIDGLPRHWAPEFKVTPELAARKDLGLHPMVVVIDECNKLFADDENGEEAAKYANAIIERGLLGIILVLAIQRPDKDSLPKAISANAGHPDLSAGSYRGRPVVWQTRRKLPLRWGAR